MPVYLVCAIHPRLKEVEVFLHYLDKDPNDSIKKGEEMVRCMMEKVNSKLMI